MRIIGGHFKGRTLSSVEGRGTRPTDARSREMLFNVLGERVLEARVLDLYGGTGSVGLEALSRGAASCVFIEQNAGACRVIKSNLQLLKVAGAAQVWQSTVKSALRRLVADGARFDLVFADPPFSNPRELQDLCKALDMAAALLHNEPGLFPDAASTSDFSSSSSPDAAASAPAVACEEGQVDEATAANRASPQVLAAAKVGGEDAEAGAVDAAAERFDDEPALLFEPMLVIQHHHRQAPVLGAAYRLWREKRAGESTLSFFVLAEEGRSRSQPG